MQGVSPTDEARAAEDMADYALPARALVVEDHPLLVMQASMMLLEIGVKDVRTAATVAEAMAALESGTFDLAILDLKLGEESGLTIAERCSDENIPVVFSTGYGDVLLPVVYKSERLLQKPYTAADLKAAIEALVQTP